MGSKTLHRIMKRMNRALERVTGYKVMLGSGPYPPDFDHDLIRICDAVAPYTLTSPERIASVVAAVDHIVLNDVPGAIVECGVWRGGSTMAAALRLQQLGADRDLWLYDTFEGSPRPGDEEVDVFGRRAVDLYEGAGAEGLYRAGIDDVRANLASTGYPEDRFVLVQGLVQNTIPQCVPDRIANLRLDTDFYDSTIHELRHLEPRVEDRGIVIIDDWGHFSGSRKASEEYFQGRGLFPARIDYSGRLFVVTRNENQRWI